MGSHPKAQSSVLLEQEDGTVKTQPLFDYFHSNSLQPLPYLFKVLSIEKCLSIQIHPKKQKAEELHMIAPDIYPDPNHKPEMAIALGTFKALVNFAGKEEILANFSRYPNFSHDLEVELSQFRDCEKLHSDAY